MSSKVIKGRNLMLFQVKGEGSSAYTDRVKAYATSHTLTLTGEVQEISTKDHSLSNALVLGKYNWEVSTEGLFTEDDFDTLFDAMVSGEKFNVIFGIKAEDDSLGQNIVDGDYETYTNDNCNYYSGNVIITSLVTNANNGENATNSITFTGVGKLVASFNWEDITTQVIKNSSLFTQSGTIPEWTFNTSGATLSSSAYYHYSNSVMWRGNGTDKSVYQEFIVPYTGIYRLTMNYFSTYEPTPTTERNYGYCRMVCYDENGAELATLNLAESDSQASIMRGKSLTALTANDYTVEVDGQTYYIPNYFNETSVETYFNSGRYRLSKQYRLVKGQKIKILIGQSHGGSKTNTTYSFPKLEYKFK